MLSPTRYVSGVRVERVARPRAARGIEVFGRGMRVEGGEGCEEDDRKGNEGGGRKEEGGRRKEEGERRMLDPMGCGTVM